MQVFKFDLARRGLSMETQPATGTAAFTDLLTDTLYVVTGTTVLPLHAGAKRAGIWRSKHLKVPSGQRIGFGWLRINGDLSEHSAIVRVYADGTLFYTSPAITNNEPVRLPAGLHRSWQFEVESQARLVAVVVASTVQELV